MPQYISCFLVQHLPPVCAEVRQQLIFFQYREKLKTAQEFLKPNYFLKIVYAVQNGTFRVGHANTDNEVENGA